MQSFILIIFIFIIFVYTFVRAVNLEMGVLKSIKWMKDEQTLFKEKQAQFKPDEFPNIVLLIPALREQRELPGLLRHLLNLDYPKEKLFILVITSDREINEQDVPSFSAENTTIEVAQNLASQLNAQLRHEMFYHIHCPNPNANKAHLLNFALSNLNYIIPSIPDDRTYIGVYDADSRPDLRTLEYVGLDFVYSLHFRHAIPPVYQQVSLYIKNFNTLPKNIAGLILRLEALYQTRWALGYELPNILSQSLLLESSSKSSIRFFLKSRLSYLIGHGCFIRWDLLKKVGGFPAYSPTEDLSLGNILSLLCVPIKPIPFFDVCEVPEYLGSLFIQNGVWFAASMSIFSTLRFIQHNHLDNTKKYRTGYLVFQRSIMHIAWALGGDYFSPV